MKRFFVLLLLLASPAFAQSLPDHVSTTVNDFADLIDPDTEARIHKKLVQLVQQKGVELTVVTIDKRTDYGPSESIETFTTALFNKWGVGNANRNDGVMILVAAGDREMRLELGSGYPASYDWLAEDVVDSDILPAFRDGRMAEGIESGVDATITRIVTPFAEGREPEQPPAAPKPVASGGGDSGGFGIFGWIFGAVFVLIVGLILRSPLAALFMRFKSCPQCGQRSLSRARQVIRSASTTSSGLARVTDTCASCGWHDTRDVVLAQHSSNDSSSSSGGSFGGGSSSGGGATGKW